MGLDGVEIVMKVEEAFDISIADEEAEKVLTPKALIELVEFKVATVELSVCLTHRAFNLLRHYMFEQRGLPRSRITPKTKMDGLVPRSARKNFLQELAAHIGADAKPPKLVRPAKLICLLAAACLATGAYLGVRFGASVENGIVIALFTAVGCAFPANFLTKPLYLSFPKEAATAGELARWIRRHKPGLANCSQRAWTRAEIANTVRGIVVDVLNCSDQYEEDARFIQDLGLS